MKTTKKSTFKIVALFVWRIFLLIFGIGLIWFTPEFQMLSINFLKLIGISGFFGRPFSNLLLQEIFGLGFGVSTLITQVIFWIKYGWKTIFPPK